jgi:hypothetical protein
MLVKQRLSQNISRHGRELLFFLFNPGDLDLFFSRVTAFSGKFRV